MGFSVGLKFSLESEQLRAHRDRMDGWDRVAVDRA